MDSLKINTRSAQELFLAPEIFLDTTTGKCTIKGKSLMGNPIAFFQPVFQWFEEYFTQIKGDLWLDVYIDYFNTSSKKVLIALFKKLRQYQESGHKLQVYWHCFMDDCELEEEVEEMIAISKLDVKVLYDKEIPVRKDSDAA